MSGAAGVFRKIKKTYLSDKIRQISLVISNKARSETLHDVDFAADRHGPPTTPLFAFTLPRIRGGVNGYFVVRGRAGHKEKALPKQEPFFREW